MHCVAVNTSLPYRRALGVKNMTSKLFVFGVIGGLVAALGLAGVFSALSTQSSAQMIQHGTMMGMQSTQGSSMHHTMFSASGMSMVQDVKISGVAMTGDNEITVNLVYQGTGNAPGVTVVAMTNHEAMMSMMMGGSMMGNTGMMAGNSMMGSSMPMMWSDPGMSTWNATQWRNWHSHMTAQEGWSTTQDIQFQGGSSVMSDGWQSGSTVAVKLNGDAVSAYNSADFHVCVFPHLS